MKFLFSSIFILITIHCLLADDVYLKNGRFYKNVTIIDSTEAYYIIAFTNIKGKATVAKKDIYKIVKHDTYNEQQSELAFSEEVREMNKIEEEPKEDVADSYPNWNPDGQKPSLHFTPFVTGGSNSYSINGTETLAAPYDYSYSTKLGFHVVLKLPIGPYFTISPFYSGESYEYDKQETSFISGRSVKVNSTMKNYYYKTGATFSIYLK